jgi:molecular chaperone DnaK (HSP70)
MGGGTFDVTLVLLSQFAMDVIGSSGKRRLGGQDFTMALVNMVIHKIELANPAVSLRRNMLARCVSFTSLPVAPIRHLQLWT